MTNYHFNSGADGRTSYDTKALQICRCKLSQNGSSPNLSVTSPCLHMMQLPMILFLLLGAGMVARLAGWLWRSFTISAHALVVLCKGARSHVWAGGTLSGLLKALSMCYLLCYPVKKSKVTNTKPSESFWMLCSGLKTKCQQRLDVWQAGGRHRRRWLLILPANDVDGWHDIPFLRWHI